MGSIPRGALTALMMLGLSVSSAQAFSTRTYGETATDSTLRLDDPDSAWRSFGQDDGNGQKIWRNTEGSVSFGMQMQSGDHGLLGTRRNPLTTDDGFLTKVPRF